MFDGDTNAGGSDTATTDATATNAESGARDDKGKGDDGGKVEFTEEQQRHIGKLLSAERKAAADKARADAKAEADAASEQARKDKEAADAKAKGDFEKVETQLTADLDAARTEAASLKAENDQLRAAMAAGIEAGWKALPEAVRKLGEKQYADDDVLGRFQFLNDPDTAALVKQLAEKADPKRGNGPGPRSSGDSRASDEAARKAQAAMYRNF